MSIIAMQQLRCLHCKSLLLLQGIFKGAIEIKCRRCATINAAEFDQGIAKITKKSAQELAHGTYTVIP